MVPMSRYEVVIFHPIERWRLEARPGARREARKERQAGEAGEERSQVACIKK